MVMKPQPEGIRRVRRKVEDRGGKKVTTAYTILFRDPADRSVPEAEIGYTVRRPHGSVSAWRSHPADGTLPQEHGDHTAAVRWMLDLHQSRSHISDSGAATEEGQVEEAQGEEAQVTETDLAPGQQETGQQGSGPQGDGFLAPRVDESRFLDDPFSPLSPLSDPFTPAFQG